MTSTPAAVPPSRYNCPGRRAASHDAVYGNQDAMDSFVSITEGTMSPVEFFGPDHIGQLVAAVAAAGH